jgi:hypothetical protein
MHSFMYNSSKRCLRGGSQFEREPHIASKHNQPPAYKTDKHVRLPDEGKLPSAATRRERMERPVRGRSCVTRHSKVAMAHTYVEFSAKVDVRDVLVEITAPWRLVAGRHRRRRRRRLAGRHSLLAPGTISRPELFSSWPRQGGSVRGTGVASVGPATTVAVVRQQLLTQRCRGSRFLPVDILGQKCI